MSSSIPDQSRVQLVRWSCQDSQAPSPDYFINVTGTWARWMTFMATEPKSRPWMRPRPRVPITMWWCLCHEPRIARLWREFQSRLPSSDFAIAFLLPRDMPRKK